MLLIASFYVKTLSLTKVCIRAKWLIRSELIPVLVARSDYEYFCFSLDGMLVQRRVTLQQYIRRYNRVERGTVRVNVLPKNTTQCPRPGLTPGALAAESSALTMRPPRLPPKREK